MDNPIADISRSADSPIGPLSAGLYVRVSTGRQEREETIAAQIDQIRAGITEDGNILADENAFADDGWTGEILQRPGLDAMRAAAMEGRFQILYVYDRGRISRIYAHQEVVLEELENRGVTFKSLHDISANTPEEKAIQAMQGVFHQYERVKIAERFRMAKLFKARQGALINGQVPFGYTRFSRTEDGPARAVVNKRDAETVRRIRTWYGVERLSICRIIERLYKLNVPPPKGRSDAWKKSTVMRLLQSDTYHTGVVYYNKTEALAPKKPKKPDEYKRVKRTSRRVRPRTEWLPIKIPRIVPNDGLFERIQALIKERSEYAPRNRKYGYLLTGKVLCACGNRRVGDGYRRNHYYRCAERVYTYPVKGTCKLPGVNAPALDEAVWEGLASHLSDPKLLEAQACRWLDGKSARDDSDRVAKDKLANAVEKASEEERRYVKAYGAGAIEFADFLRLANEVKRRKSKLKAELGAISDDGSDRLDQSSLGALCRQAVKMLPLLKGEDRSQVVRDLISKVVIGTDNRADVWAHVPVATVNMGGNHAPGNCRFTQRWQVIAF